MTTKLEEINNTMNTLSDKMNDCINDMINSNERRCKLIDDYFKRNN
jgi:hypothetical protein